ncbi:MAG: glycosyltransferase, partial [Muribaculaceae bacterium]|nr:glycosyltransferase [Muribaculaceae bacterium]
MEINSYVKEQLDRIKEKCETIKPLVVIKCTTYNHGPYIKDALDGFVMQKTDFPFVAIVHDDASTDNTASIIKEYAKKYPDIILPIFEEENQYSKRDGSLGKIINEASNATGAKYIALCEGDDYWTYPLKLQKQVHFLQNNPEYGLIHTNIYIADWKNGFQEKEVAALDIPSGDVYRVLLERNFIFTASVLYRSDLLYYVKKEIHPIPSWDRIMWICMSRHSKFHYISDRTTVYRILKNSATHGDYKKVLETEFIGTNDLLRFLERNDISKDDVNIFLFFRSKKILRLCYYA